MQKYVYQLVQACVLQKANESMHTTLYWLLQAIVVGLQTRNGEFVGLTLLSTANKCTICTIADNHILSRTPAEC